MAQIELKRAPAVEGCCAPLDAADLSVEDAERTAELFRALGDARRIRIVNFLANSDEAQCVCDITATVGLSQPTVSFHLKKLTSAGLLDREQVGTWAYFSINEHAMKDLSSIVQRKGRKR